MIITIKGTPIAKKRPRFFRRGNFEGAYNPQETEEGRWLWEAQDQITEKIEEGPISLKVKFSFPPLKSWPKKTLKQLQDEQLLCHFKKPDLDNCIKFVKDCLNGIAWHDDSQVSQISAIKCYALEAKTEIEVKKI